MTGPTINQNLTQPRNPSLRDLLDLYQKQILLNFNCHHIATIQSFDKEKQTVQVTINYKHTYFIFEPKTQQYLPNLIDYPIIADCPLIVIGGGTARITFPISKGDQCILLFNDRDIDNWFSGSTTSPNSTPRLHALSDCVALIGPNNLNTVIENYDDVRALLTNGTVKNGINPETNKLTLQNEDNTLNDLLQSLCTQLENLTTALAALTVTGVTTGMGTSGPPTNASVITNIGTNISNIATQISGLIE